MSSLPKLIIKDSQRPLIFSNQIPSKSSLHQLRLRNKKHPQKLKHWIKRQMIKNRTLSRASKLIKRKNQSLLSKLEFRPRLLLMSNLSSKKLIRLLVNLRLALLPQLWTMPRWESRPRSTSQRKIRTRLYQFLRISSTLVIRRMIAKRKMSLLKPNSTVLIHPLNQQPSPWPKKLPMMLCHLKVANQQQILRLKLLPIWITRRALRNLRRTHLIWPMQVLAAKMV